MEPMARAPRPRTVLSEPQFLWFTTMQVHPRPRGARVHGLNELYSGSLPFFPMRATTSLAYSDLVRCVEDSLVRLEYGHLKNATRRVTEFEVQSPCHFRVLVEDETRERYGFALLRSEKNESSIEILRTLDASESEVERRQSVATFVNQLRKTLPGEPWKGFGFFRSKSEKVKWSELADRGGFWQG